MLAPIIFMAGVLKLYQASESPGVGGVGLKHRLLDGAVNSASLTISWVILLLSAQGPNL